MSLTYESQFECPYCMVVNDIEIDTVNDLEQQQIVDCQICCAPIEVVVREDEYGLHIDAKRDDE